MKALATLALALATLSACSKLDFEEASNEKLVNYTFSVTNYEQISLESSTRAGDATALNHLALGVYDAESNEQVVAPSIQDQGSEGYGTFSLQLPAGNYRFVFLGYDASRTIDMSDPTRIAWDNQVVTNTFHKTMLITPKSNTAQEISLSRAVGVFSLVIKDEVPTNVSKFRFEMEGGSYQLNATTGLGNADAKRIYTFSTPKQANNVYTINLYAFLPQRECTTNVSVAALDANGNTIHLRHFKDVPMKLNQRTRYTGEFFVDEPEENQETKMSFTLDDDVWSEEDFSF